ncbi:MAG: hypothetical protein ACOYMN_06845 [Roseimicrobium sp.]
MMTMTKKALLAALKERLAQDDRWALRALSVVYRNQTADEQSAQQTLEHNGIGFSGPDAEILSSFAQQYQRRGSLSPKQMNLLKRKIPSYASQVARVADMTRLTAVLSCPQHPQAADSRQHQLQTTE